MLELIGFDGDDTLWHSEGYYQAAQAEFERIVGGYLDLAPGALHERLYAIECENIALFGYGAKGMTLSMVERFAMIGNSLRSDIAPVITLGGYGVYMPYHVTRGARARHRLHRRAFARDARRRAAGHSGRDRRAAGGRRRARLIGPCSPGLSAAAHRLSRVRNGGGDVTLSRKRASGGVLEGSCHCGRVRFSCLAYASVPYLPATARSAARPRAVVATRSISAPGRNRCRCRAANFSACIARGCSTTTAGAASATGAGISARAAAARCGCTIRPGPSSCTRTRKRHRCGRRAGRFAHRAAGRAADRLLPRLSARSAPAPARRRAVVSRLTWRWASSHRRSNIGRA